MSDDCMCSTPSRGAGAPSFAGPLPEPRPPLPRGAGGAAQQAPRPRPPASESLRRPRRDSSADSARTCHPPMSTLRSSFLPLCTPAQAPVPVPLCTAGARACGTAASTGAVGSASSTPAQRQASSARRSAGRNAAWYSSAGETSLRARRAGRAVSRAAGAPQIARCRADRAHPPHTDGALRHARGQRVRGCHRVGRRCQLGQARPTARDCKAAHRRTGVRHARRAPPCSSARQCCEWP
jgi:hypothetical protein